MADDVLTGPRIELDRDACCSSGNCVGAAPEVFDQDEADGLVMLRIQRPPADLTPGVRRAAQLCPSGAIRLVEPA
ncbi:ferredoxin [Plantactinospora siamensis]|uniref:Ferredoxin n=1 Tax=Plantactinospora siamensis TaxID=555372 RepID=A0ABV6P0K1_9ACTN